MKKQSNKLFRIFEDYAKKEKNVLPELRRKRNTFRHF